jgi:hypothetical protein
VPRKPTPRPLGELVSVMARLARNVEECEKAGMLTPVRAKAAQRGLISAMNQLQDQVIDRKRS